jgi:hypothetical protein
MKVIYVSFQGLIALLLSTLSVLSEPRVRMVDFQDPVTIAQDIRAYPFFVWIGDSQPGLPVTGWSV